MIIKYIKKINKIKKGKEPLQCNNNFQKPNILSTTGIFRFSDKVLVEGVWDFKETITNQYIHYTNPQIDIYKT